MTGTLTGVEKTAARRLGVSVEEWRARRAAGEKWCTACDAWHPITAFPVDRSRGDSRRARCTAAARGKPRGTRDPQREAARSAVAYAVKTGRLASPNVECCTDCGHRSPGRRHEYDHHRGYAPEHYLDVEVVCTLCHADREKARRG